MSSYAHVDHSARMRVLLWAWAALTIVLLASVFPAKSLVDAFSAEAIVLKPWILIYNSTVIVLHGIALFFVIYGARGSIESAGNALLFWGRKAAFVLLGLALLATVLMLGAPLLTGRGPLLAEGSQVQLYRSLVFAAPVLRSAGWACLVLAMSQGLWVNRKPLLPYFVIGCAVADTLLGIWKWLDTPVALVAALHPLVAQPLFIVPWTAGSFVFLFLIRVEILAAQSAPPAMTGNYIASLEPPEE